MIKPRRGSLLSALPAITIIHDVSTGNFQPQLLLGEEIGADLGSIPSPPKQLYARGNIALLAQPGVAVVGSRRSSRFGQHAAKKAVAVAAQAGYVIISGLAYGIDAAAHRAALANQAPTIVVLGCGVDRVYPADHKALAQEILRKGGLVISEQELGASVSPQHLVARNRLQTGLAKVVVIVESGLRGGTLHTARFALQQGRTIICPASDETPFSEGVKVLISRPANELPELLPAFKAARRLCREADSKPIARAIGLNHLSSVFPPITVDSG